jgi:hypothetical protein
VKHRSSYLNHRKQLTRVSHGGGTCSFGKIKNFLIETSVSVLKCSVVSTRRVWLPHIVFICRPVYRIVHNVFPDLIQFGLAPNDVFVIIALPDREPGVLRIWLICLVAADLYDPTIALTDWDFGPFGGGILCSCIACKGDACVAPTRSVITTIPCT